MVQDYIYTIIICAVAIVVGILLGNGAVYFFNKIPGKWLCDYGKEPDEELLNPTKQRIRSIPWKYVFSCLFIMAGIKMGLSDPIHAMIAILACWLLLEMAIADIKYMIVPDQLIILLMLAGAGFVPHHEGGPFSGIYGALAGFGIMFFIGVLGKIFYKKQTLGGGDIKLFTALGLCLGVDGVLTVFVMSTLMAAMHLGYLLAKKRVKMGDERPFVPYIALSAMIYLVILREMSYNIMISF